MSRVASISIEYTSNLDEQKKQWDEFVSYAESHQPTLNGVPLAQSMSPDGQKTATTFGGLQSVAAQATQAASYVPPFMAQQFPAAVPQPGAIPLASSPRPFPGTQYNTDTPPPPGPRTPAFSGLTGDRFAFGGAPLGISGIAQQPTGQQGQQARPLKVEFANNDPVAKAIGQSVGVNAASSIGPDEAPRAARSKRLAGEDVSRVFGEDVEGKTGPPRIGPRADDSDHAQWDRARLRTDLKQAPDDQARINILRDRQKGLSNQSPEFERIEGDVADLENKQFRSYLKEQRQTQRVKVRRAAPSAPTGETPDDVLTKDDLVEDPKQRASFLGRTGSLTRRFSVGYLGFEGLRAAQSVMDEQEQLGLHAGNLPAQLRDRLQFNQSLQGLPVVGQLASVYARGLERLPGFGGSRPGDTIAATFTAEESLKDVSAGARRAQGGIQDTFSAASIIRHATDSLTIGPLTRQRDSILTAFQDAVDSREAHERELQEQISGEADPRERNRLVQDLNQFRKNDKGVIGALGVQRDTGLTAIGRTVERQSDSLTRRGQELSLLSSGQFGAAAELRFANQQQDALAEVGDIERPNLLNQQRQDRIERNAGQEEQLRQRNAEIRTQRFQIEGRPLAAQLSDITEERRRAIDAAPIRPISSTASPEERADAQAFNARTFAGIDAQFGQREDLARQEDEVRRFGIGQGTQRIQQSTVEQGLRNRFLPRSAEVEGTIFGGVNAIEEANVQLRGTGENEQLRRDRIAAIRANVDTSLTGETNVLKYGGHAEQVGAFVLGGDRNNQRYRDLRNARELAANAPAALDEAAKKQPISVPPLPGAFGNGAGGLSAMSAPSLQSTIERAIRNTKDPKPLPSPAGPPAMPAGLFAGGRSEESRGERMFHPHGTPPGSPSTTQPNSPQGTPPATPAKKPLPVSGHYLFGGDPVYRDPDAKPVKGHYLGGSAVGNEYEDAADSRYASRHQKYSAGTKTPSGGGNFSPAFATHGIPLYLEPGTSSITPDMQKRWHAHTALPTNLHRTASDDAASGATRTSTEAPNSSPTRDQLTQLMSRVDQLISLTQQMI